MLHLIKRLKIFDAITEDFWQVKMSLDGVSIAFPLTLQYWLELAHVVVYLSNHKRDINVQVIKRPPETSIKKTINNINFEFSQHFL